MRYQNVFSFLNHLKSSYPDNLLSVYGLYLPDPHERGYLIFCISSLFPSHRRIHVKEGGALDGAIEAIHSLSLFESEKPLIIIERKLTGEEERKILPLLSSFEGIFIYAGAVRQMKDELEKLGVVLDLHEDKQWEKKKRFALYLTERAKKERNYLSQEVAEKMVALLSHDLTSLFQELEKLLLFAREKKRIDLEDLEELFHPAKEEKIWKGAEELIFKRRPCGAIDKGEELIFFSALRFQLQMGLKLILCKREEIDPRKYFPKIWPKTLEMREREALSLGASFFREGIVTTFQQELKFRTTGTFDPVELYGKIYALSPAE